METKKIKKKEETEKISTLKLVSMAEDILPIENRSRVFNELVSSLDSMAEEVVRHYLSQEPLPLYSPVNRTLH